MKYLKDYKGVKIRLTSERLGHILEHPEMSGMKKNISEALLKPDCVVQSGSDFNVQMYYRYYVKTAVGNKYLCVVVKWTKTDPFVLTAYLTNKIKKGNLLWKNTKQ